MGRYNLILKALNKVIDWLSTYGKSTKTTNKLVSRPKFIVLEERSIGRPIYDNLSDERVIDIISGNEKLDEGITTAWDPALNNFPIDQSYLEAVEDAHNDALMYFTSDLRRQVDLNNIAEASSLGMRYHPNEYTEYALTRPLYIYNTDLGAKRMGKVFKTLYNYGDGSLITRAEQPLYVMRLNPLNKSYYPYTAYHEHLHMGNLGESEGLRPNETLQLARSRMSDNKEYLTWKLNLLMLSPEEIADINYVPLEALYRVRGNRSFADLIYDTSEISVSLMEAGKLAGIKPGMAYPGDEGFDLIYNDLVKRKEFCVDYLKYVKHTTPLEKRNVWKALNGTFFLLPAALLLGTWAASKNNVY